MLHYHSHHCHHSHHHHQFDDQALRESEEEARLREEGVDDVESIGVDPLDERFAHVADDHDMDNDIADVGDYNHDDKSYFDNLRISKILTVLMHSILPDNSVGQPPDTKVGNIRIKQVNIVIIIIIIITHHHHHP